MKNESASLARPLAFRPCAAAVPFGLGQVLERLDTLRFTAFTELFRPEEGRIGLVVTFLAVLELLREAVLELVQSEPFAPIYLRRQG